MPLLTPDRHWLGVLLCALAIFARAESDCTAPPASTPARVAAVVDGDTVRLGDGTLVRLVGINTPELGRDGRPDEPLAAAAGAAVRDWLGAEEVLLLPGEDAEDRHGRRLASLFRKSDGAHLGAYLLRQGLGWQVVVPPNARFVNCLREAEREARREQRGVWSPEQYPTRAVDSLAPGEGGFQRLRGRVTRVAETRRAYWLEFGEQLSVRVARADAAYFPEREWSALEGKELTLRGWLIYRGRQKSGHPPHLMHLRHPVMLESIKE